MASVKIWKVDSPRLQGTQNRGRKVTPWRQKESSKVSGAHPERLYRKSTSLTLRSRQPAPSSPSHRARPALTPPESPAPSVCPQACLRVCGPSPGTCSSLKGFLELCGMSWPTSCCVLLCQIPQLRGTREGTGWEPGSPEPQIGYETLWTGSQAKASPGFGVGSATGSGHGVPKVPSCGMGCRGLCSSWFRVQTNPPRPRNAGVFGALGARLHFFLSRSLSSIKILYVHTHIHA